MAFVPEMSTDSICVGGNTSLCLSDKLDDMDAAIKAGQGGGTAPEPMLVAEMHLGKLDNNNGAELASSNRICSDPIAIQNGKSYWQVNTKGVNMYVLLYNADEMFVQFVGNTPSGQEIPISNPDVAYLRLCSLVGEYDLTNEFRIYDMDPAGGGSGGTVDAYTKAESDARFAPISHTHAGYASAENLAAHTGNKSNPHGVTASQVGAVPTTRTVNGKALSGDISLTAAELGAVPTTRTVNGKALSANITLSASELGAAASSHTHSAANITSGTFSTDRLPTTPVSKGGTGATTAASALTNLGAAGRAMAGQSVQPSKGVTVTAKAGAEVFNDNATRTYSTSGSPTAGNVATGEYSHAEGNTTTATGRCSHAEGKLAQASGENSHAEGWKTVASGLKSHAEGDASAASETGAHAEGIETKASGAASHAEGRFSIASGQDAHAEGQSSEAYGAFSHAEGIQTLAAGDASHAEGLETIARGNNSHAAGYKTEADDYQYVIGTWNVLKTAGNKYDDRFIIGSGSKDARENAFRVHSNGSVYGRKFNTSGADYAELFEWADGNPSGADRTGLFVTLDGEKLRLAEPQDTVLGVVSGDPSVVGDVYDDQWSGMYLRDVFGRVVYEDKMVPEKVSLSGEVIREAHMERGPKLNPDYRPDETYLPRTQRLEWAPVGMLGKLVALDDGSCEVNGYCTVGVGGVATKASQETRFRVMARLDETHVRLLLL